MDLRLKNKGEEADMLGNDEREMENINDMVSTIEKEENRLLAIRRDANEEARNSSSRITLVFEVLILILLLLTLVVIYRNTAARDKAEARLRESEQLTRAIINNTSSPITIRDLDGKYVLINKPVTQLLHRNEEDIIGKSSYDFLPAAVADEAKHSDEQSIKEGKVVHAETVVPLPDGVHYFTVNRFPLFDDDKNVIALGTVSTDITSMKKAEEEIRSFNAELEKRVEEKTKEIVEREQQYRFLIENMREGIQVIGHDWRYIFVNESLVRQSKYSKEQLLDHTIMENYPGVEESELFAVLKKCMVERIPQTMESEFRFPDGSVEWFELSVQPVPEGIFILSMDITGRKKAELERLKIAEDLRRSNTELERFAYVASHDLQEPLRMVSSFLNLLEEEFGNKLDETAKNYIFYAVDGAARMKTLVNDLLQYSRIGNRKEAFVETDLNDTLQYAKNVLADELKKSEAKLSVAKMPTIVANKALVGQLFINLISNALKYHGAQPPVIDIGFTEEPEQYVFYVKDNGIGIDPKFFDKIFIIFQRLHTKEKYAGTGIGLAICKKIAEIHNGKIWVESKEGGGSTFYFSIAKKL